MKEFTYIDPEYKIEKSSMYHISIQANLNGYSFAVLDPAKSRYLLLSHQPFSELLTVDLYNEEMGRALDKNTYLSQTYQSVCFAPANEAMQLVPQELNGDKALQAYLQLSFDQNHTSNLENDLIEKHQLTALYQLDSFLATKLINKYGRVSICHPGTTLIQTALGYPYNTTERERVFIEVDEASAHVMMARGEHLLLYNQFHWKTPKDFLFYLLAVYEQQGISPENTPLVVSGFVERDTELYQLLMNQFRSVVFEKLNARYAYSREFNHAPEHAFVNLFNLYECGLSEDI